MNMENNIPRFLHLYQANQDFESEYNGEAYHEDWVSYTVDTEEVHYNKQMSMTVQELIDAGYAEVKQDRSRNFAGSETGFNVIQIHTNCPILLENIPDFDDYLVSSTTFVWREELPAGWRPNDLADKYNNVDLARPIMAEMFPCVDMSGVDELSLSFAGGGYQYINTSIVTERYHGGANYYPNSKFKSPKHLTLTVRGTYSSVLQTNLSELRTTTGVTINCQAGDGIVCHDTIGMFEMSSGIRNLVLNGKFSWSAIRTCHNMFDACNNLVSIPYSSAWSRENGNNTLYPHAESPYRGSATCGGLFSATSLEYIGPVINMDKISISGVTTTETYWDPYQEQMVTGPVSQGPLPYYGKPMFNCPVLEDVLIINLNNNDWNFADDSTYTYIPEMNTASIEYLLTHVADCTGDPHTVTFSSLHQNDVSASAISAAAAKGWTVAWQQVD